MKKRKIRCPYCGANASLRPVSAVYGDKALKEGYVYVCDRYPVCDAYVTAHQKTLEPMGTLANGDLRNKRIKAHKAFGWLWESGLMTKWQAYKWMQVKMGLSPDQAHIAKFGEYRCDQLITICQEMRDHQKNAA